MGIIIYKCENNSHSILAIVKLAGKPDSHYDLNQKQFNGIQFDYTLNQMRTLPERAYYSSLNFILFLFIIISFLVSKKHD